MPRGWHKGVRTMRKGEEAELILAPAYAHGAAGRPPSVPEGASVRCRLELLAWTAPRKEAHELTLDEALAEAATLKAKGTDAFKGGAWAEARGAYERAAGLLAEREEGWGGEAPLEDDSPARALLLSCWLNAAQCALKLEQWVQAKRQRDFETADRLRAEMKDAGFNPEDYRPRPGGGMRRAGI